MAVPDDVLVGDGVTAWDARTAAIVASMLGLEPDAGRERTGGWPQALHEAVSAGLDASVVGRIARLTGWTPEEVCQVADLPSSRATGMGHLDRLQSERACRVGWIAAVALVALDGSQLGQHWYAEWSRRRYETLDGRTPKELMASLPGSIWLRDALDTWLHGIPT